MKISTKIKNAFFFIATATILTSCQKDNLEIEQKLNFSQTNITIEKIADSVEKYYFLNGNATFIVADKEKPELTIGKNGNWYINGKDTYITGKNGVSSFQIWRNHIATGNVKNPHYGKFEEEYKDITNDKYWDYKRNSIEDYFLFITNPRHVE